MLGYGNYPELLKQLTAVCFVVLTWYKYNQKQKDIKLFHLRSLG